MWENGAVFSSEAHMQPLHLIIFTSIWTATWIAPWPKLSKGAELTFGLIPFGAFGLRVFASFFQGVPAADPVRQAVAPLLAWVAGDAGGLPYQIVLDTTIALGMVWFASAFDIPRKSRVATAWILPAVATISLASVAWLEAPVETALAHHLPPPAIAALAGCGMAAVLWWTPSEIPERVKAQAAIVLLVLTPAGAVDGAVGIWLADWLGWQTPATMPTIALVAGGMTAAAAWIICGLTRPRSRSLLALAAGVAAGASTVL
jgi:hypothetical protein